MIAKGAKPRRRRTASTADVEVRVHYPLDVGRLVLRSEVDWERDLEPVREVRAAGVFDFSLPMEGSHRYFKVVRLREGAVDWAQGDNMLAVRGSRGRVEVWPHFSPDDTCHVCDQHSIPSKLAAAGHRVRVFLPPGYGENTLERFPAVYMQDGHNLFFPEESFAGETWRVEETLRVLQQMNLTRKVIVVGVYPSDRTREYTQPGCEEYGRALVEELVPWVDEHYRTIGTPESTVVMGSSLGGVVSLHLAWRHPHVFGGAACLSSTFGFADDLLQRVSSDAKRPIRVYLDSGWPHDNYEATRSMRNALSSRGFVEGDDLHYFAFPRATHDERSWALRIHVPFQLFFGERAR